MKKLAVLFLVFALSTSTAFANNADDDKKKKDNQQLRTEIVNLLGSGETTLNISCKAMVSFMINNEGEIVVISVDSKNNALESYVKRKLNYKKVSAKIPNMKIYTLPLRVKRR